MNDSLRAAIAAWRFWAIAARENPTVQNYSNRAFYRTMIEQEIR